MIPVNEPLFEGREAEYLAQCVRTGWISSDGSFVKQFERDWAAYCGRRYGVAVANGTAALELAVACLDLRPGDEVILPTFTIMSCAQAVVRAGGVPVLVDADPRTWCMDVSRAAARVTGRTRAIMPVHIYGHPVDMDPLIALARERGVAILEDAAEVHGAEYCSGRAEGKSEWRRCGSLGDLSCFSFYANKIVTTGEGGMVLTDNPQWAERLADLRNLCFGKGDKRFLHTALSGNARMTNLQAAVGVAQIEQIDRLLERKRWMGRRYTEELGGVPGIALQAAEPWARPVYWMYGIVLDESTNYDAAGFGKALSAVGVQTRPFFLGMHEQPALRKLGLFQGERYPVADRLARQGLYLPSGLALTEAQIAEVCRAVRRLLGAEG